MKKYLIIAVSIMSNLLAINSQDLVKKEIGNCKIFQSGCTKTNRTGAISFYKIKYKDDDSDLGSITYPIRIKTTENIDTISLIQELLSFEGDTDICCIPVKCWNLKITFMYEGDRDQYSIQVEALFIINQLYFKKPFFYSPYPIIKNIVTKEEESVKGEIIRQAYIAYKQWFEKVKEVGITEARKRLLLPFDNTNLGWVSSMNLKEYLFTSP